MSALPIPTSTINSCFNRSLTIDEIVALVSPNFFESSALDIGSYSMIVSSTILLFMSRISSLLPTCIFIPPMYKIIM